tara:strand:- start:25 stop:258 length:234 start_codon:yes stop_codon:yes gene_type:complete
MNYNDFTPVKDLDYKHFNYKGKDYLAMLDTVEDDWATFILQDKNSNRDWDYAVDFRVSYDKDGNAIYGDVINVEQSN